MLIHNNLPQVAMDNTHIIELCARKVDRPVVGITTHTGAQMEGL